MSEFTPPKTRRQQKRIRDARIIIGSFEHERSLRVRMNAQDAIHGIGEEWHEAREELYDFYARYGKPAVDNTNGERFDVV